MDREIFIGWDSREQRAWSVCQRSIVAQAHQAGGQPLPIRPISMGPLQAAGLYERPTTRHGNQLRDDLSQAPMSTEFSLARFWVPQVSKARWALFCDGDILFRADVSTLFDLADARYAVQVVKHNHTPAERIKMDGQIQTAYPRKNWSSVVLWNLAHAGTRRLWRYDLNSQPGLWLHNFGWLHDSEIGELPAEWNWLEGSSDTTVRPAAVHYTRGTPDMIDDVAPWAAIEWRGHLTAEELRQERRDRLHAKKTGQSCKPENCATA